MFPLLMAALAPVGVWEILGHRMVWSLATCLIIATVLKLWQPIISVFKHPKALLQYAVAALLISVNWGVFVYAVIINQVSFTALGYYVNPLLTVAFGVVFFQERLRRPQLITLGLAVIAVAVVAWDLGQIPWISLVLAVSFSLYTLTKKSVGIKVGALAGMTVETLCLLPVGLGIIIIAGRQGTAVFGQDLTMTALLIFMGMVTALVLMLFSAGASRLPLYVSGLLQYISPTMSFTLSIVYFGEQMSGYRWIGFGLIWAALIIISYDAVRSVPRRLRTI